MWVEGCGGAEEGGWEPWHFGGITVEGCGGVEGFGGKG